MTSVLVYANCFSFHLHLWELLLFLSDCTQPYCENGCVGSINRFWTKIYTCLSSFNIYFVNHLENDCCLLLKEQLGGKCQEAPVITNVWFCTVAWPLEPWGGCRGSKTVPPFRKKRDDVVGSILRFILYIGIDYSVGSRLLDLQV